MDRIQGVDGVGETDGLQIRQRAEGVTADIGYAVADGQVPDHPPQLMPGFLYHRSVYIPDDQEVCRVVGGEWCIGDAQRHGAVLEGSEDRFRICGLIGSRDEPASGDTPVSVILIGADGVRSRQNDGIDLFPRGRIQEQRGGRDGRHHIVG